MEAEDSRIGAKVRIILVGNFHYSGIIKKEDDCFLIIIDKFGAEVSLRKSLIQVLEVTK